MGNIPYHIVIRSVSIVTDSAFPIMAFQRLLMCANGPFISAD